MATSSKDIEILWQRYSDEGGKQGISVRDFFERNGIPYHVFEKWYKRKFQHPDIVDCNIVGAPQTEEQPSKDPVETTAAKGKPVAYVSITFSNGVKVEHRRLTYPELLCFISKLESLCSM